jgi:hypothetical protein
VSDCKQMTLVSCETNRPPAVVSGLNSEQRLARAAWSIIRHGELAELSKSESEFVHALEASEHAGGDSGLIDLIRSGRDPLGDALMHLRPPKEVGRAGRRAAVQPTPVACRAKMVCAAQGLKEATRGLHRTRRDMSRASWRGDRGKLHLDHRSGRPGPTARGALSVGHTGNRTLQRKGRRPLALPRPASRDRPATGSRRVRRS